MIHSIIHFTEDGERHQCAYDQDGKQGAGYYCVVCKHVDWLDRDWVDLPFDSEARERIERDIENRRWGEHL